MNNSERKTQRFRSSEDALFEAYQLDKRESVVTISNHNVNVRILEAGSGDDLLIVHGGPSAGAEWASLASYLTGYRCLILDRPGCGLSEAVDYRDINRERLHQLIIDVCEGILDHYQIDKAPVAGSSFGGYWAFTLAAHRPDRVSKLVIEGCPALVEGMIIPDFMKRMTNPVMRWLIPKLPTSKGYTTKIMKYLGHTHSINAGSIPDVFIDWYVSLSNNTDTLKNELAIINKVMAGGTMDPEYVLTDDQIARIPHPALWIWGRDDPFGDVEMGNRISSKMPHSTLIAFENQGHLPWLDDPKGHAAEIREFLEPGRRVGGIS